MRRLADIQALQTDDLGRTLLSSLTHVNPTSLTQADAQLFMSQKIPNATLQEALVQIIATHKNNVVDCVRAIDRLSQSESCEALITTDRQILESGTAMLMLGTEIDFNRTLIQLLQESGAEFTLAMAMHAVQQKFARKLSDPMTEGQYRSYIEQRLPLAWAMKYQPERAASYFLKLDQSMLPKLQDEWKMQFMRPDAVYATDVTERVWPKNHSEESGETAPLPFISSASRRKWGI